MAEKVIPGLIRDRSSTSAATPFQVVQGTKDVTEAGLMKEAGEMGFVEALGASFVSGGNAAVQLHYDLDRMSKSGPVDPNWRQGGGNAEWVKKNSGQVPANQAWRYMQTKNATEAQLMLDDANYNAALQAKLARRFQISPVSTFTAMGLASLVDVDAPLTLFTGGLSAGAKIGINATKIGRLLSGAATGAAVGIVVQATAYGANPVEDWTSIPLAGLGGAAFGVVGGALKGRDPALGKTTEQLANKARTDTLNEFGETVAEGNVRAREDIRQEPQQHADPYGSQAARDAEDELAEAKPAPVERTPQAVKLEAVAEAREEALDAAIPEDLPTDGRSTVGARQLGNTGPGVSSIRSTRTTDIIQNAKTRNQKLGVGKDYYDNMSNLDNVAEPIARAAKRFQDAINASPIVTDFNRFMRSGSVVGQMLAYDLLESASGIVRNNRSGAMLMDHYQKDMLGNFLPYHDAFDEWAGRVHTASIWKKITDNQMREDFNTAIIGELNERNYGGNPTRVVDTAVKNAADAIDRTFAKEIEINVGRPGEGTTKGYETLIPKSGYFPQKWVGGKMQRLMNSGKYGSGTAAKKAIVLAISEAYRTMHPSMNVKDATIWAEAVVDRSLSTSEGISSNLVGIMKDNDGRRAIEDLMERNGASRQEIDRLIDSLTGNKEEAGRAGHTKHRLDLDLRFKASNGITIRDLIATDINKIVALRARKAAGSAAMSRKGIYSRADMDEIREAILREQAANGPSQKTGSLMDHIDSDKHLTAKDIDDMFSYFTGQPIAGGISPMISRIRKMTNLSLLNQLGLTQMAEFGPMIAAVGFKKFSSMAGKELMDTLKKVDSPLVQELKHMNVFVPEERMFRDDLTFDYEKFTGATSEYMQKFDNFLNKGQRLQGYTSAFYAVRKLQQRIAMTTGTSKIMEGLRTGGSTMTDRLRDAGFDAGLLSKVKQYVDNGTVEFDADGNLVKLNLDKWDADVAENFILTTNRQTNQMVQKAMAGESSMVFHRDGVAALFWHLKSFPMLALEKQAMRNARLADGQAMATFMYGLATAAAAYTVKQTINGRTENLTPAQIAREAFGLSNMTGWIPMWIDPLAGMLGMDSYKLSSYGSHGATSVLSMPPAITTLDRLSQAPASLVQMLNPFSELSNSQIRDLQVIPIIGNAYGFSYIFNAMKNDTRKKSKPEDELGFMPNLVPKAVPLQEAAKLDDRVEPDSFSLIPAGIIPSIAP